MSLLDPASADGDAHARWRAGEAQHLLDRAASARHPAGGFGVLGADGALALAAGRPLYITARMTHCLALGHLLGRGGDAALVDEGLRALRDDFADPVSGGWFADADRPGQGPKQAYGHAFVVLAASTATVAGRPWARPLLDQALDVVTSHFVDDASMPIDTWDLGFAEPEPYRGANAAMHLVEALLAASDACDDPAWLVPALAICEHLVGHARTFGWRMPEHYDADWAVLPDYSADEPRHPFRPYGATPGHGLEWARLLLTLDAALGEGPAWLTEAALGLATTAVADGWDEQIGGFVYTTDLAGVPVVRERFHWVVCEAIGAAWALHAATGEQTWEHWYVRFWQYAQQHLVDDGYPGLWRHEVDARNAPVARTWTDRPDVYHALQATLLPSLPLTPGLARALAASRLG